MLVLGIDPGTARTGYGLVSEAGNGDLQLVAYGVIKTVADIPQAERLHKLHSELKALIDEHHPAEAAVERLFFQKNVSTAMSVGQARGVILLALQQAGLPVGEYGPQDIKQAVTGYGAADKVQMQRMVKTLLAMSEIPKPDDAADALAIAICHCHSVKLKRKIREAQ
ncbi:MAG: crossover junction endodeoxyribonuclease RuvC [Anaerolineales bacterium]